MIRPILLVTRRELSAQRNATLGWLIPLVLLMVMYGSLQPQVAGDNGLLAAKLALLPESVKQAFSLNATDFSSPVGYLSTNFIMVTLGASLFAGLLGANVVAREELQRTAESLLTLPVARWQVLSGKLVAALVCLASFHLVLGTASWAALAMVATQPVKGHLVAAMFLGAFLLGMFFVALGLGIGTLSPQARAAPMVSLGMVLGTYFLGVVGRVSPRAEAALLLSPYRLVEPADILRQGGLAPRALMLVVTSLAVLAVAFGWFSKKDLHA
jgi:ABC-2 type transport system permease protein